MQGLTVLISGLEMAEYDRVVSILNQACPTFVGRDVPLTSLMNDDIHSQSGMLILRATGDPAAASIQAILVMQQNLNPIFILVDEYEEKTAHELMNKGADRVLSMQELERTLPGCLEVYLQEFQPLGEQQIKEDRGYYPLPDSLQDLQKRLHKAIGSSNFLESILNTFAAIVVVLDKSGRILFFNPRAEIVTGYSQNEVIDRYFQDLFLLPEERESVMQVFSRLSSGEYPNQNRNAWIMRNGDVRQIEWSNTVLEGPDNETLYVIGMGLDISDDHLRNKGLRESEERFSRIFRSNPLGMAILKYPDGTVLDINESFLRLLEVKPGDVVGKPMSILGLLPPDDLQYEQMLVNLMQSPIYNLERKVLTSSKRLLHLVLSLDIIEFIGDPCILIMVQDMTEWILSEQRVRRFSEELERSVLERTAALQAINRELQAEVSYRKAIESSSKQLIQIIWETPDIVSISSLTGQVQYLNKAGRRMFGLSELDSVSHLSIYSAYSQEFRDYLFTTIGPYVNEHGIWYGETELILSEGRVIPVSQVVIEHRDGDGNIQFYSSIARDITDQRKASEDLRLAYEKEKQLGLMRSTFFSMTSHQFRTPLSTILSSAELIEHYGDQWAPEKRKMHTLRIQEATQRLTQMLDDILDYLRLEAHEGKVSVEEIDLAKLCEKYMQEMQLADWSGHTFNFRCVDEDCLVYSDRQVLECVVENLLSNAIKYSPANTKIQIDISRDNGLTVLMVKDEGIGISEADLDLIFQPFQRGSNVIDSPGSGLGLMIVKKSLELVGGDITFHSQLGKGTEVTVFIPDMRS